MDAPPSDSRAVGSGPVTPDHAVRDALIVIAPVVVLAILTFGIQESRVRGGDLLTLVSVVLPLLAVRRWPIPVLVLVAAGSTVTAPMLETPWVQILAVVVASATVGELASDRTRSLAIVTCVGALMAFGFLAQDANPLESMVLPFVFLLPSWLLGDVVRMRRLDGQRRAAEVERSIREREERLRAAAVEERRHVARELHDVVAHAVSVMVIQAGAARQVVRTSPDQAESSLLAIEATGRDAMGELRRFLGALDDGDETGGLAPQPGIGEIGALVDRVREAGLPASLEVDGQPRTVSASLDMTAYRIVQEALTNALRYARQATTVVRVVWDPDQLRLEVLDDGPGGTTAGGEVGAGRGLVGMRDRAALVGGRLESGPRLGGGYAVRAWLPTDPATNLGPAAS